jgi:hypothetical protein
MHGEDSGSIWYLTIICTDHGAHLIDVFTLLPTAFDLMETATQDQLAYAISNTRGNASHGPFAHLSGLVFLAD